MADIAQLRKVIILCCRFARNLAFYRVGQYPRWHDTLLSQDHPQASFWRQANANFLDVAVLEWCKLLGDQNGKYYWKRIVSNKTEFESQLLRELQTDACGFRAEVDAMRCYRDKFVAHLDKLNVMNIPKLECAKTAIWFYHRHIVTSEIKGDDLAGISADTPEKLCYGYNQCLREAEEVFSSVAAMELRLTECKSHLALYR